MRLLGCVVLLAACGSGVDDGDGGGTGVADTKLEGIYSLSEWTRNETDCAAEGPSVLATESDKHVVIRGNNFFGQSFLEMIPCPTLDQCRIHALDDAIQITAFGSVEGSDSAGWTGGRTIAGGTGGTCTGLVTETTLTTNGPMTIQLRAEHHPTGDFPTDAEGFCTIDDAEAAAAAQPCNGLDVLRGTFTEALP